MTSIDPRREFAWIDPAWRHLDAIGRGLENLAGNGEATQAFIRRSMAEAGAEIGRIAKMLQILAAQMAAEEKKQ